MSKEVGSFWIVRRDIIIHFFPRVTYTLTYISSYRSRLHEHTHMHQHTKQCIHTSTIHRTISLVPYSPHSTITSRFSLSLFSVTFRFLPLLSSLFLSLFLSLPLFTALHVSLMILSFYFMCLTFRAPPYLFVHCRYFGRRLGVRFYRRI